MKYNVTFAVFIFFILCAAGFGQEPEQKIKSSSISDLSIGMQWYLSYINGEEGGQAINKFTLKRGYVNIKKKIDERFSGRITTDLTVDKEGDGEGDVEIRLKYLYLKYQMTSLSFFTKPFLEIGLVHRPWIDFEQHINDYRVQGRMFLERTGVVSSGDFGISFHTLLGGEMDAQYKKDINSSFAGKYGSFSLGVFNGGGYHALEKNLNKTVEGRLTIRPLHNVIPGLQVTWHGAYGKGNIEEGPDWNYNSGFLSYEHKNFILTGEYYRGIGNYKGSATQDTVTFKAVPQNGFSFFGEVKLFNRKMSLIGRHDNFIKEFASGNLKTQRNIAGVAYHFVHGSKILVVYDTIQYKNSSSPDDGIFEIAIELKY